MKKPTRNYLRLVNEIINIQSPFDTEIAGIINYDQSYPFISLHTHSKLAKWNVVVNSGAHGTESVGVRVMLRFLQEFNKELLGYYNLILFPIVNPFGYVYNRRKNGNNQYGNNGFNQKKEENLTSEAKLIRDTIPNKIDLFIDVHADSDKNGFYIYERKRPEAKSLAEISLKELRKNKIPILEAGTVYYEKCVNGVVIQPIKDGSMDDSMFQKGAIYSLCLEIPGKIPEDQQMIGGLMLLNSILKNFKEIK
jgi:predicted deacylase